MSSKESTSASKAPKQLSKEEELLLQDYSRSVTTKSYALFYSNAFIVAAVPICKQFIDSINKKNSLN
jgi:hypothetical protein